MVITVKAVKTNGEIFEKEIERDVKEIQLSYRELQSIDLSQFSKFKNLKSLYLSTNHFREINLYPLRLCKKLEELYIDNNPMEEILSKETSEILEKLPEGLLPYKEKIQKAVKN